MIFKDVNGDTIRIPAQRLCGRCSGEKAYIWTSDDVEVFYEVSQKTFRECMRVLGDEAVEDD